MKKTTLIIAAATLALAAPAAFAAMDHGSMPMDHGSMDQGSMGHGSMKMEQGGTTKAAHVEVVDGVKASFDVYALSGPKDTHHIMVMFTDAKTGKAMSSGEAALKVMGPDKGEQTKQLMQMGDGFGANFSMTKKGKYGVMCKFKLADGKVRQAKFWYTVK